MTEHTPGPWVYHEDNQTITTVLEGEGARKYDARAVIAEVRPQGWSTGANGHLLAAAPELLKALGDIVQFCDDPHPDSNISLAVGLAGLLPNARAAIAKATTDDA